MYRLEEIKSNEEWNNFVIKSEFEFYSFLVSSEWFELQKQS
jgi:hypothetical protein